VSHHLDSPASRRDPRLNLTDTYVFDGEGATVVVMAMNSSLAGNGRVPGFHPEGRYEVKVHLDGGPAESLTYRVAFGPRDADGAQGLRVHRLTGADAADDGAPGEQVAQGRTGEVVTGDGVRVWAGAARTAASSPSACCPTSCPTASAPRPASPSPASTAARCRTMRRRSSTGW
jgi:hypothetical protein